MDRRWVNWIPGPIRWVLFLPLGFGASIGGNAIGYSVAWISGVPLWGCWICSGIAGAGLFLGIAFYIAPKETKLVKWLTVVAIAAIGAMATIGFLLREDTRIRALQGISMIIGALSAMGMSTDDSARARIKSGAEGSSSSDRLLNSSDKPVMRDLTSDSARTLGWKKVTLTMTPSKPPKD